MLVFEDSLLVSEISDWVNLLQPSHEPQSAKAITRIDSEADPEDDLGTGKSNYCFLTLGWAAP